MQTIFLDRDGVINENRADHVKSWDEFQFLPGSLEALSLLTRFGFRVFVVTNQAMINRGLADTAVLKDIHRRLMKAAQQYEAVINAVYYCPHREEERCLCRKPRPGMLMRAAAEWNINMSRAYMVGDALSDIRAGHAVGCRAVLVRTGRGAAQERLIAGGNDQPEHIADNLLTAVKWVLSQELLAEPYDEFLNVPLSREAAT